MTYAESIVYNTHTIKELETMNRILTTVLMGLAVVAAASAQALDVNVTVNTTSGQKPISPLIYGINAYVYDSEWQQPSDWKVGLDNAPADINIASRRLGGNTMTSYNWENGFSNSGNDDNHSNNTFQSFIAGAGSAPYAPGAALTTFHGHSLIRGAFSLLQLPSAGYVAADDNGAVSQAEAAPSARWKEVVFDKPGSPGSLSLAPDLNDDKVYIDEEMNFLIDRYGNASTATGIKGYELDNEPGLWHHYPSNGDEGTHSRLHPELTTCIDLIDRDLALARTIKRMDPAAEVFGPAMWGYPEFYSLWSVYDGTSHQPSDWGNYNTEPWLTNNTGDAYRYNRMTWVNAFLDHMRIASEGSGVRLLDVFSVHYYPDDEAVNSEAKRVQAPRSLWDPTFVETSWITQNGNGFTDGRSLELIPKLQRSIADFYPGTKLAITEYSFGGRHQVTGGIAQADALGIFGKVGLYAANYFFTVDDYIASAFRIYRNYDGQNSTFGATSVASTTSDIENSSTYSSLDASGDLHIIFINKSADRNIDAHINIAGTNYTTGNAWLFDGSSTYIRNTGIFDLVENSLLYSAPPYSVSHIVLHASTTGVPGASDVSSASVSASPNPFGSHCTISYTLRSEKGSVTIVDMLGNVVRRMEVQGKSGTIGWDGTDMNGGRCASGIYTMVMESEGNVSRTKVAITR
jgi:mannan endo-1,4-beta-mannosidase